MKKTKIIATIGPASFDKNILQEMIIKGADIIRINLSHADVPFCNKAIKMIREIEKELNKPIGIMLDLDGPSVRLDKFAYNHELLEEGHEIKLYNYPVICNNTQISVNYQDITKEIKVGDEILLSDGNVILEVEEIFNDYALLKVKVGGEIASNKTVYFKDSRLNLPFISQKDYEGILYGIKNKVDFLALSYVRNEQDVLEVLDILIEHENNHINVIAKIENKEALENLDEIAKVSDGLMVARGDLGIEVSLLELPTLERNILDKALEYEKVGVVATDFLMSMEENPHPSRSEVTDVYNAVMDKSDAIMLSGETTIGKYPVLAVETLSNIIINAEQDFNYEDNFEEIIKDAKDDITANIAYSASIAAKRLNAKGIVANTMSGYTAMKISHIRSHCPILGCSPVVETVRLLTINYGIIPLIVNECKSTDTIVKMCTNKAKEMLSLEKDDIIVITGSFPIDNKNTNFMKIEVI